MSRDLGPPLVDWPVLMLVVCLSTLLGMFLTLLALHCDGVLR